MTETQLYLNWNFASVTFKLNFFETKKLSCNPTKTDVIHLHSRFTKTIPIPSININQHSVIASKKVRNLGVLFDNHLTMSGQINSICRSAPLAIRNIGRIRKYLDQTSTERLVHAFITSKRDYCNSLLPQDRRPKADGRRG